MQEEKITTIIPSERELKFLIDYFQGFSRTFLQRYGKVDFEALHSMHAPLFLDSVAHLINRNIYKPELNQAVEEIKETLRLKKDIVYRNFKKYIKPDFCLLLDNSFPSEFKVFKINQSFFLLEYNLVLDIKAIVNFYSEKEDFYKHQENFILLIKKLIDIFE